MAFRLKCLRFLCFALLTAHPFPIFAQSAPATSSEQAFYQFKSGNINASIVLWSQLIDSNTQLENSLYNRSQAYLVLRQYELALLDLTRLELLYASRPNPSVFLLKGIVLSETANYTSALSYLTRSLSLSATPYAFLNRAIVYQKSGNLRLAEADMQQAVMLDSSPSFTYNLAAIKHDLMKYTECVTYSSKVISAATLTFYPAYTLRGICNFHLQAYKQAIADLLRSSAVDSSQADVSEYLGRSLLALARPAEARGYLLKAADLYLAQKNSSSYSRVMKILSSVVLP